jgi:hypothetical protein
VGRSRSAGIATPRGRARRTALASITRSVDQQRQAMR